MVWNRHWSPVAARIEIEKVKESEFHERELKRMI